MTDAPDAVIEWLKGYSKTRYDRHMALKARGGEEYVEDVGKVVSGYKQYGPDEPLTDEERKYLYCHGQLIGDVAVTTAPVKGGEIDGMPVLTVAELHRLASMADDKEAVAAVMRVKRKMPGATLQEVIDARQRDDRTLDDSAGG